MDIKLKKYKSYQIKWKIICTFLLVIFAMVNFFSAMLAAKISTHWETGIFEASSIYETYEFKNKFAEALDEVIMTNVYYRNENHILSGNLVNREELITDFKRYYGIKDGVITGNTQINEDLNGLIINGYIPNALESNFEEYKELVESRLPSYQKMHIQNQLDQYKQSVRKLNLLNNFLYYVEDGNGNIVSGNTTRKEMDHLGHTVVLSSGFSSDNIGVMTYSKKNALMEDSTYKVYAGARDPFEVGDEFYDLEQDFLLAKVGLPSLLASFVLSSIIVILCMLYLIRVAGQSEKDGPITYLAVDQIYNEIHFAIVCTLVFFSGVFGLSTLSKILYQNGIVWAYIHICLLGIVYIINVATIVSYITSVSRQIKGKVFLKNTWISVTIRRMAELFTGRTLRGWMIVVMLCYGLGNCVLTSFTIYIGQLNYYKLCFLFGVILFLFNALCIYLFVRALRSLKYIMISARETSKGNLQYKLELEKISPSFINFATDIANIQDGLKNSVEEALKGEKMKAELITNVSHDLKTPLTSIISYVDLLRGLKLENQVATKYVQILHDKSYRLKQLIEDLIEVSKITSGNITVVKTRLDYRQITLQAIGELEEKIQLADLEIKVSCPEPLYIDADGRHLWRILENLVSNVAKYSMPSSRVYIDIFKADDYGILVMKNISAIPVDFDEARLTDRFVRGDSSRTTEGSGLGLSIAQSLANAQAGTFEIEVDGDLFKAIVSMPLWKGEIVTEYDEEDGET